MKHTILVICLTWFGLSSHGQEIALFGAQFDYSSAIDDYHPAFGIQLEGMLGNRINVHYNALYSPIGSDEYYFYVGGGQVVAVFLMREAIETRSGLALAIPASIISFVLPESFTYRYHLGESSQLGLFLAPYGFEYIKNDVTGEEDYEISLETGIRYYWNPSEWLYLVPQMGIKMFYDNDEVDLSFGISAMIKLKEKK